MADHKRFMDRVFLYDFAEMRFRQRYTDVQSAWQAAIVLMFSRVGAVLFVIGCTIWILLGSLLPPNLKLESLSLEKRAILACVFTLAVYLWLHWRFRRYASEPFLADAFFTPKNRKLSRLSIIGVAASPIIAWAAIRSWG